MVASTPHRRRGLVVEVEIEYCVPCGHLERAIEMQRLLLGDLGGQLAGVRLRTGSGGVFKVRVDGEEILDAQRDVWDPDRVRDDVTRRLAAA
jgi:selenoprotein W-related protein